MKLVLLYEDGVLDYKGEFGRTYATPNAVPAGSLKGSQGVLPASPATNRRVQQHLSNCPQCSKDVLCTVGKLLMSNSED